MLRYHTFLDACGYIPPRTPRTDLGLVDRVDILRAHYARRCISVRFPPLHVRVSVPRVQGLGINIVGYHEGVYAQYSRTTRSLNLYQFPSLNHGVERKEWFHSSPAAGLVGLSTSATVDLLVWVAASHPGPFERRASTIHDYQYTIYLRSLSTNFPHPDARVSTITHRFQAPRTIIRHTVHILGNLLAVLLISGSERIPSRVTVWDWATGLEITVSHVLAYVRVVE